MVVNESCVIHTPYWNFILPQRKFYKSCFCFIVQLFFKINITFITITKNILKNKTTLVGHLHPTKNKPDRLSITDYV